jgi:hypothetical protein
VFAAFVIYDGLGAATPHVFEVLESITTHGITLIRLVPTDGFRPPYSFERLFDDHADAVAWAADQIDATAAKMLATAAEFRQRAEVTV